MDGEFIRAANIYYWHFAGTTGLPLKLVLLNAQGQPFNWNTLAFVANMATATWADLQFTMGELVDTGPGLMSIYYVPNPLPAAIVPGAYTLIVQNGVTAVSPRLAIRPMRYDGTYWSPATLSLMDFADGTYDPTPVGTARTLRLRGEREGICLAQDTLFVEPGDESRVAIDFSNVLPKDSYLLSLDDIALTNLLSEPPVPAWTLTPTGVWGKQAKFTTSGLATGEKQRVTMSYKDREAGDVQRVAQFILEVL